MKIIAPKQLMENQAPVMRNGGVFSRASLDLQFARTRTLDSRITFSRASSGTYVDAAGVIRTAGNNVARFDHNPTTGESLGLLVEESRTNLLTYSEDFSIYTLVGTSLTANAATAPDGNVTATQITEDTSTGQKRWYRSIGTVPAYTTITWSIYVKPNNRQGVTLYPNYAGGGYVVDFNLNTLTSTGTLAGSGVSSGNETIEEVGNGWYRLSVTITFSSSQTGLNIFGYFSNDNNNGNASYTGDGSSGLYLWGAQLEAGSFPTSYIPTEGSTVTRAADVTSITGTNFSSWYEPDEGTVLVNAKSNHLHGGTNQFPRLTSLSDGTTSNVIDTYFRVLADYTDAGYSVVDGGSSQASFDTNQESNNTSLGTAYKVNDFAFAQSGSLPNGATDNSGTVPTVNQLSIGRRSGVDSLFTGTIRRITYWPTRLSNDTLQTITR